MSRRGRFVAFAMGALIGATVIGLAALGSMIVDALTAPSPESAPPESAFTVEQAAQFDDRCTLWVTTQIGERTVTRRFEPPGRCSVDVADGGL